MENKMEARLAELKTEFESGQQVLAEMEGKRSELQATLMRISGAIQVLEEMLEKEGRPPADGADGAAIQPGGALTGSDGGSAGELELGD